MRPSPNGFLRLQELPSPAGGDAERVRGALAAQLRAPARGAAAGRGRTVSVAALRDGHGSKLNDQKTAGFSPWFHLPGFHFGYQELLTIDCQGRNHPRSMLFHMDTPERREEWMVATWIWLEI